MDHHPSPEAAPAGAPPPSPWTPIRGYLVSGGGVAGGPPGAAVGPDGPPALGRSATGGEGLYDAVVDDLYRRLLADAALAPAFAGVDLGRLRRHQALLLAFVLGGPGPQPFEGAALGDAHRGRGITDADVDAALAHLAGALAAAGLFPAVVEQATARVAWLHGHVVDR